MKYVFLILLSVAALWAEKVQITSDNMKAMELKKEIHFMGNAKVIQLDNWIHGDEIIVYFDENNQTKKYEAIGNVTFEIKQKDARYKGSAEKVIYHPQKSEYLLKGKAVIDDLTNKRHVNGDEIVLDMKTGNAEVTGKGNKPVKFIFDMEKQKGE